MTEHHASRWLPVLVATASCLVGSCQAGSVAKAVRPADATYSEAVGEKPANCHSPDADVTPLVVDWPPEARADLEVAMRESVALVHYDCDGIRVLRDCKASGNYTFVGMTQKEQVISLRDADEIRANLPLSGLTLAARLQSELKRGSSLQIALLMVGKTSSSRRDLERAQLDGKCDGATHFVRRAIVGAFAMKTATAADVTSAAQVLGVGLSGSSSSHRDVMNRDGSAEACAKGNSSSTAAPEQCAALVRLELSPVTAATAPMRAPEDGSRTACPKGMSFVDGKCSAGPAKMSCDPHIQDPADCNARCAAGDASSCMSVAHYVRYGKNDVAAAADLYTRACELGDQVGCMKRASLYASPTVDDVATLERGCAAGIGVGCFGLGAIAERKKDRATALSRYDRACRAGDLQGCHYAGDLLADHPDATQADRERAGRYKRVVCDDGEHWNACSDLARQGMRTTAASVKAVSDYRSECNRGAAGSCSRLAFFPDGRNRVELNERACKGGDALGCTMLGLHIINNGPGTDHEHGLALVRQACKLGLGVACLSAAAQADRVPPPGIDSDAPFTCISSQRSPALAPEHECYPSWWSCDDSVDPKATLLSPCKSHYEARCDGGRCKPCPKNGKCNGTTKFPFASPGAGDAGGTQPK